MDRTPAVPMLRPAQGDPGGTSTQSTANGPTG